MNIWTSMLTLVTAGTIGGMGLAGINQTFEVTNLSTGATHQWNVKAISGDGSIERTTDYSHLEPLDLKEVTDHTCHKHIPAGSLVLVAGEKYGSRVKFRPEPFHNKDDGSYVLVGQSVRVLSEGEGQGFYKVRYAGDEGNPVPEVEGYIHCSLLGEPNG